MLFDLASLPPRQAVALRFVQRYFGEHATMPTVRELAAGLGCSSPRAAAELIEKLIQRGALSKIPGVSRGLRLTKATAASPRFQLPLIGRIAAGKPIMAGGHVEEMLDVNPDLFRPKPHWLFRVEGSSMKNIGVLPGDLVGVREDAEPPVGTIVAALILDPQTDDLRLTLKRYKRRGGRVVLLSENDDQIAYAPQVYDPARGEVRLVGRYAGLIRQGPAP